MKENVYWNGSCEIFKWHFYEIHSNSEGYGFLKKLLFDALDDFPWKSLFIYVKQCLIIKIVRIPQQSFLYYYIC